MKYKFLEHTADAKFQAYGTTLEEAFKNAALAMFSLVIEAEKVQPILTKRVHIGGADKKSLLYNFLEKLLYLLDTKSFLLNNIKDMKIHGNELSAVLVGDIIKDEYKLHTSIKAVTYNEMIIGKKNNSNEYLVQVVVDI